MKLFILALFVSLSFSLRAQDYERIANAFATGNAGDVVRLCTDRVDYSLDGKEQSLSKAEVEGGLRNFFKANEPNGFKTVHKGVSQSDLRYMIAELSTSTGLFRTTVYLKKNGEAYLIQSLEIEKQ